MNQPKLTAAQQQRVVAHNMMTMWFAHFLHRQGERLADVLNREVSNDG